MRNVRHGVTAEKMEPPGFPSSLELDVIEADEVDALQRVAAGIAARGRADTELALLAVSEHSEVRVRVPALAGMLPNFNAEPLLVELSGDEDSDVRAAALEHLEAYNPAVAKALQSDLSRILESDRDGDLLGATWRLLIDGDPRAPVVARELLLRAEEPDDWQAKAATVLLQVPADPQSVADAIQAHDHDRMPWLCYGAVVANTPETIAALEWGAEGLPDEGCRSACRHALAVHLPEVAAMRGRT